MNERDASGEPAGGRHDFYVGGERRREAEHVDLVDSLCRGCSAGRFVGRWDRVSQWLVHRAASATPRALAARLEEEWLADIATRPSVFSRLRFALGCCWATMVIAHELSAQVPVTSTATGPNL